MLDVLNNKIRVALYCRVSTEEQRQGQTIESQVKELEHFAASQSWVIVGTYKDEGWTGSILARPELDRLRDDASNARFDSVLVNDVDRLARDVAHVRVLKRDFERKGVKLIFRKIPGEESPTQNLLVNVLGSFAEFERELIADRTRRGKRYKVEVRKQYVGAIAPYGLRYIRKKIGADEGGQLQLEVNEAAVVRMIYRCVDEERLSARAVVRRLNESGLQSRKAGGPWQKSTVLRILRSEVYAGIWHYNKHQKCEPLRSASRHKYRKSTKSSNRLRPKSEWLPVSLPDELRIIDPAQWQRVQEKLNANGTFSSRNAKHFYLLSSLVRCGGCKASYVGEPSHGRFSYRCSKRCKTYPSIRENLLNDAVWNAVADALRDPAVMLKAVKAVSEKKPKEPSTSEQLVAKDSLTQIQNEESRILQAYRREILSQEQLARELAALKTRKALVESRGKIAEGSNSERTRIRRPVEEYCRIASERLTNLTPADRRRVIRLIVQNVIFEGNTVRIAGVLPIAPHDEISGVTPPPQSNSPLLNRTATPTSQGAINMERIAGTTSWDCGRNPFGLSFELVTTIDTAKHVSQSRNTPAKFD